ncbi:MAG: hypothetical protein J7647_31445, partial [Cyanobacteria bacterium SBLK]|nr:hypothetical protein [Cyanobacteria bacterium SBLK]
MLLFPILNVIKIRFFKISTYLILFYFPEEIKAEFNIGRDRILSEKLSGNEIHKELYLFLYEILYFPIEYWLEYINKKLICLNDKIGDTKKVLDELLHIFPDDDKTIENYFKKDYHKNSLLFVRISLILCLLLYGLFGILDGYVIPDIKQISWFIRYGGSRSNLLNKRTTCQKNEKEVEVGKSKLALTEMTPEKQQKLEEHLRA